MSELNIMETMLGDGQDNALIRFTMGSAFIKHKKYEQAVEQLAKAVELEPGYTAAWLKYAQALLESGRLDECITTLEKGISVADRKNDTQSFKKMQELLNSLQ
jgi:predicted Zn-dependent protease